MRGVCVRATPDAGTRMLCNEGYFHILSPIYPPPQIKQKKLKQNKPPQNRKISEIINSIKHFVGKAEKIEKSITEKSKACLIIIFFLIPKFETACSHFTLCAFCESLPTHY